MGNQPVQPNCDTHDASKEDKPNVKHEIHGHEQPQDQKEDIKAEKKQSCIDIAFVLDCTGSMSSYIQSCKDNINTISTTINKETNNKYDTQFGLILYRDIPPQDSTFITKRIDFTPIPLQIQLKLNPIRATGGGDAPEALASGLYDCYKNLKWRENSVKVIVVITDAPPHGLEKASNDGFPDGDPDTFNENPTDEGVDDADNKHPKSHLNVIQIVQSIRDDLNASIYSVACEPSVSCSYDYTNDFMQYMAEYTDGKFLPLSNASLLPSVIIGSIQQQINLDNLSDKLEEAIKKIKKEHGEDIDNDTLNALVAEKWKNEGVERKEIAVSDVYKNKRSRENVDLLMNEQVVKSLADFKKLCKDIPRMQRSDFMHSTVRSSTASAVSTAPVSDSTERKTSAIGRAFSSFSSLWNKQPQQELDEAVCEAEMGFGRGLDVGFNPLATGFNPMATGVPGMNRPQPHGGKDFIRPNVERPQFRQAYGPDMRDVRAEVFQVRQDYGQVAAVRGGLMCSDDIGRIRAYGSRKGKDY